MGSSPMLFNKRFDQFPKSRINNNNSSNNDCTFRKIRHRQNYVGRMIKISSSHTTVPTVHHNNCALFVV